MTFLDHLEELRKTLLQATVVVGIGMALAWHYSARLLDLLVGNTIGTAVFLSPMEPFSARLKVAFLAGLMVSLPFVVWRVWRFVVPGLFAHERRMVKPLIIGTCLLFYAGMAFGYAVLTPTMMKVLLSFGTSTMRPEISIGNYLGLTIKIGLACGLVFEMPLVIAVLTAAGVVTPGLLVRMWRYALLGIAVASALLTPTPDIVNMMLLAIPTTFLYFVSVGLSFLVARGKRRREAKAPHLAVPEGTHAPRD
jgi:sec-independent protein translocase protein TatC